MPVTQINDGNGLNAAGGKSIRNRSLFINKYPICGTYQFGKYTPCFCAETVVDDDHTIHIGHNVISNTLKAPLLQDVILKKDLFWVPDMCILPFNWEKFFVNPVKGEDVPNDVGCGVEHFGTLFSTLLNNWRSALSSFVYDEEDLPSAVEYVEGMIKFYIFLDMTLSSGSLPASLQASLNGMLELKVDGSDSLGQYFDAFITTLRNYDITLRIGPVSDYYQVSLNSDMTASEYRVVLDALRDDFEWSIYGTPSNIEDLCEALADHLDNLPMINDSDFPYNLRRLWAYQIVCAHFYTNDKIDYVYSAELFRQLVYNSIYDAYSLLSDEYIDTFNVNGLVYQYDFLSAHYFATMCTKASPNVYMPDTPYLQYFRLLFGHNNSLRYLDYFTGSRSQPLAVGDVTVAVNSNMVNVVDVAAKTMAAKMLNVANRVGQRIESYVKEFFGIEMAKDYHNPFWLAHTADQIDNPENQNTASEQYSKANSITSIFRSGGNSQAFQTRVDRAGVLIGIEYFDIQRVYPRPMHRNVFHIDRYDDFLPYLQYVGDQSVSAKENDGSFNYSAVFGYQGRNMEYKQQVPYCFGGFAKDLAPYIFLANEMRLNGLANHIGPSYIRSLPQELDRFFNMLNGYSNETYYHFAIVNNIYWEASRPMAALPGILNG